MRAEYEGLTQEFYTRTGKLDQAQDLAFQQIQKTWHLTSVNGKPEIMKWGPTAAETPVLRAGIEQSVKALGLFDDPKTIQLTPFGGTTLSQGRYWNLSHANGDLVLDGKNQPVTLDASKGRSLYADRLAKQQAADKASAAAAAASAIPKAQAKRAADQSMVQGNEPLGPT